jgi:hypothetical protein
MGKLARVTVGFAFVSLFMIAAEARAFAADEAAAPKLATPEAGEARKEAIDWRGIYKRPAPTEGVEVSPLFGYASNSLGVGAGLRAGYTFKEGAYVGAAFTYHHGIDVLPGDATARVSMLYPAAEVGYDVRYESVSFRPYAGAGMTMLHASMPNASGFSDPYFIVYPGLSITARPDGSRFFAGLDARLAMPIIDKTELSDVMSVGVYGVAGLHL